LLVSWVFTIILLMLHIQEKCLRHVAEPNNLSTSFPPKINEKSYQTLSEEQKALLPRVWQKSSPPSPLFCCKKYYRCNIFLWLIPKNSYQKRGWPLLMIYYPHRPDSDHWRIFCVSVHTAHQRLFNYTDTKAFVGFSLQFTYRKIFQH